MNLPLVALLMAFLVMGFGDVRGSFVGIAKEVFGISSAQGALIPLAGAISFALFSLPAGLFATRKGKKYLLQAGLLFMAGAHLLPCFLLARFSHLLLAIFLIGFGMTCLLVAGNPLLREVTAPERYPRNLTFAQFVKSLGSIAGPYFIAFIVVRGFSWKGIFPCFALLALLAWAAVTWSALPEDPPERPAAFRDLVALMRIGAIRRTVLGLFLFTGSEMGMNTYLASHMWLTFGMDIQGDAIRFGQGLFWLSQGIGRLLGTLALSWVQPRRFLLLCAFAGMAAMAGLCLGSRTLAIAAVVLAGMSFSNVWPSLFALTLQSRPRQGAELAGLAVMANLGGAVVPFLMGWTADLSAVRWAFLVPLGALAYVTALAWRFRSGTA